MSISIVQLKNAITELLEFIPQFYSEDAVTLMLMTAIAESDCGYYAFRQHGGGPGRGIMQVEIATMIDNYDNYLRYRPELMDLIFKYSGVNAPNVMSLEYNVAFNIYMARLKYYRSPGKIPHKLEDMAKYHELYYNGGGKACWEKTLCLSLKAIPTN